jgi:hypothetical protein
VPNLNRMSRRVRPTSAGVNAAAKPTQDLVATAAAIGAVAAGVALFEVALIPGLVIGGAAVLAPRYLPGLGKRLRPRFKARARALVQPAGRALDRPQAEGLPALPAGLQIGQAVAKTITFRLIVTTLDFSSNYLVIGELGTAAGLSGWLPARSSILSTKPLGMPSASPSSARSVRRKRVLKSPSAFPLAGAPEETPPVFERLE